MVCWGHILGPFTAVGAHVLLSAVAELGCAQKPECALFVGPSTLHRPLVLHCFCRCVFSNLDPNLCVPEPPTLKYICFSRMVGLSSGQPLDRDLPCPAKIKVVQSS